MSEFEEIESGDAFQWPRAGRGDRSQLVQQLLQVQFPQAVRGYDREAVDRYIEQVRAVVTELETPASPDAAVRRAIEEITDETRDVLLRAQQTAQEMTTRAEQRSDALTEQTERQAAETRETAEREATELRATSRREAEELWNTAQREVSALRATAQQEVEELRSSTQQEVEALRTTAQREVENLWSTAQDEVTKLRETTRRETDQMIAAAETRCRELDDSIERLLAERRRLLEDMETVSKQLGSIAAAEADRFSEESGAGAPSGQRPAAGTSTA